MRAARRPGTCDSVSLEASESNGEAPCGAACRHRRHAVQWAAALCGRGGLGRASQGLAVARGIDLHSLITRCAAANTAAPYIRRKISVSSGVCWGVWHTDTSAHAARVWLGSLSQEPRGGLLETRGQGEGAERLRASRHAAGAAQPSRGAFDKGWPATRQRRQSQKGL